MFKRNSGFTLIELLIVISLLGTLAVALLAAIDPFEQFKKGSDTGVRNTVQEFHAASIRYYAQRSGWPSSWLVVEDTLQNANLGDEAAKYIDPLVAAGELKSNFIELGADQIANIDVSVYNSTLLVCFKPTSKSFQAADKNVKYISSELANGEPQVDDPLSPTCTLNDGPDSCYWCVY